MSRSKWSYLDNEILNLYRENETLSYHKAAWSLLGEDADKQEIDLLRTYIKRFVLRSVTQTTTETSQEGYVEINGDSFDAYCREEGLDKSKVKTVKFVNHQGQQKFNVVLDYTTNAEKEIDFNEWIDSVLEKYPKRELNTGIKTYDKTVTRLIYADTHIGMSTDSEGTAMYPVKWDKETIFKTLDIMCNEVIHNKKGDTLLIDDLGDFLDGWNGETTRKGHKLPQNMNNREAFEVGLEFKMSMLERLTPHFESIVCNNVSNDNHAGDFASILNHSFRRLAEHKYNNVEIRNMNEFIEHYYIGEHAILLCHGKDKKSLKFGFKPQLDSKQIEKIDHYLKQRDIYKYSNFIEFSKGDSHQMLFDYTTSQDFNYMNYPALSPSSEWVQTNFKAGKRGFVIQHIDPNSQNIDTFTRII